MMAKQRVGCYFKKYYDTDYYYRDELAECITECVFWTGRSRNKKLLSDSKRQKLALVDKVMQLREARSN